MVVSELVSPTLRDDNVSRPAWLRFAGTVGLLEADIDVEGACNLAEDDAGIPPDAIYSSASAKVANFLYLALLNFLICSSHFSLSTSLEI